jgi:hypothetical protein
MAQNVPNQHHEKPRSFVLSNLAVFSFGDSSFALASSLLLLVVSIIVALWIDSQDAASAAIDYNYQQLGSPPRIDKPRIFSIPRRGDGDYSSSLLTTEMRTAFQKDGVIAVRGLISTEGLLDRLDAAATKLIDSKGSRTTGQTSHRKHRRSGKQFHTVDIGTALQHVPPIYLDSDNATTTSEAGSPFFEVALFEIPSFVADLMELKVEENHTLRLLRDIFLAKDMDPYICGYHVDDTGFWPATFDAPGINAWIALDDMPTSDGGGFALAIGSHTAEWRYQAYHVTGSTYTLPSEGWKSAADMFANRTGNGTCNIQTSAPHLYRRMEETKRIYNVKRGDVILSTRWLFHRTVPFVRDRTNQGDGNDEPLYRRYSIRYGPGYSEIPRGFGTEPSVNWDERNGGRTADEVSLQSGPFYPRVWPTTSEEELLQLKDLIQNKLPVAEERIAAKKKEMKPYLQKVGRKQQQH